MKYRIAIGATLTVALLACGVTVGETVQSGPAKGQNLAPFHPLNVTGQAAGQKLCLV
jgi:hypothetical protein